jgi:SAM-dependent methyltransferase
MTDAADWLVGNIDLIPKGGVVLDVASGRGRNALFLAHKGWRVHAVDRDDVALGELLDKARAESLRERITTERIDLETGRVSFGARGYAAVVVFNYLHRPLMPAIVDAVAPGGVLLYETFTAEQRLRGRPRNPAFLLDPAELPRLVAPLKVVRAREGEFDGKCVASVAALR